MPNRHGSPPVWFSRPTCGEIDVPKLIAGVEGDEEVAVPQR